MGRLAALVIVHQLGRSSCAPADLEYGIRRAYAMEGFAEPASKDQRRVGDAARPSLGKAHGQEAATEVCHGRQKKKKMGSERPFQGQIEGASSGATPTASVQSVHQPAQWIWLGPMASASRIDHRTSASITPPRQKSGVRVRKRPAGGSRRRCPGAATEQCQAHAERADNLPALHLPSVHTAPCCLRLPAHCVVTRYARFNGTRRCTGF